MEETIELRELLEILLKRKWMILISVVVAVLIGALYSVFLVTPIYQSDTTLMVNSSKGINAGEIMSSIDMGSISLSQKLVVTYGEIVQSRIVLEQVIANQELDETYESLLKRIDSKPVGSTEILKITVKDTEPERAARVANSISDVFVKEVMRILKINNVETIDRAIPIDRPINVKSTLNIMIALVLGLMVGVFIAFALEYMDNSIKTSEDAEKALGLVVIGTIPDFEHVDQQMKKGGK